MGLGSQGFLGIVKDLIQILWLRLVLNSENFGIGIEFEKFWDLESFFLNLGLGLRFLCRPLLGTVEHIANVCNEIYTYLTIEKINWEMECTLVVICVSCPISVHARNQVDLIKSEKMSYVALCFSIYQNLVWWNFLVQKCATSAELDVKKSLSFLNRGKFQQMIIIFKRVLNFKFVTGRKNYFDKSISFNILN